MAFGQDVGQAVDGVCDQKSHITCETTPLFYMTKVSKIIETLRLLQIFGKASKKLSQGGKNILTYLLLFHVSTTCALFAFSEHEPWQWPSKIIKLLSFVTHDVPSLKSSLERKMCGDMQMYRNTLPD